MTARVRTPDNLRFAAGDRRTALAMASALFEDEGSRAVCERVLLSSSRRVA